MNTKDNLPPNSLYHIFEDKEKDPSKILAELDKGLRSVQVGEQCESILFFGKLLNRYPFPSIVNSSLLKLADLFHGTR
jgi:integrator complex subunit 7